MAVSRACRRARTVSIAVAYILLLVAAFLAEAVLVAVFTAFLSREASIVPRIVEQFSEGLVYGAYTVAPMYIDIEEGSPRGPRRVYTVVVPGLHVALVNPNPFPTEVVLVMHNPGLEATYKVVDVGTTFGFKWDAGSPPEGVEVVRVDWFKISAIGARGLRMAPRATASFSIPIYDYGVPETLLACTRMGCTRLAGPAQEVKGVAEPSPWIILAGPKPPFSAAVSQTWEWVAETYGGSQRWCVVQWQKLQLPRMTIIATASKIDCCSRCPPGTSDGRKVDDRGRCEVESGSVESYSLARGFPPNVVVGYYAKDEKSFDFRVPSKTITIRTYTYKLRGFDKMEPEFISAWLDYDHHECFVRNVTLTIRITAVDPKGTGKPAPLNTIWSKSAVAYVYVAAKGHSSLYPVEKDTVVVEVYALGWTGSGFTEHHVGTIVATDGFVDNALDVENWSIETTKYVGIKIVVRYRMEGPLYTIRCFRPAPISPVGPVCGRQTRSTTRLGFYVEVIPHEFLTK